MRRAVLVRLDVPDVPVRYAVPVRLDVSLVRRAVLVRLDALVRYAVPVRLDVPLVRRTVFRDVSVRLDVPDTPARRAVFCFDGE